MSFAVPGGRCAGECAENSINGTYIGVVTDPLYRGKGFTIVCMAEIYKEMVSNNKKIVLFYNNPEAGILYKKLGFEDIGKWSMGTIR